MVIFNTTTPITKLVFVGDDFLVDSQSRYVTPFVHSSNSWVSQLCQKIGIQMFVNTAEEEDSLAHIITGSPMSLEKQWHRGLEGHVLPYAPSHCILNGGIYDIQRSVFEGTGSSLIGTCRSLLVQAMNWFSSHNITPILFFSPANGYNQNFSDAQKVLAKQLYAQIYNLYQDIASEYGVKLISLIGSNIGNLETTDSTYFKDHTHFNDFGNTYVAQFCAVKLAEWFSVPNADISISSLHPLLREAVIFEHEEGLYMHPINIEKLVFTGDSLIDNGDYPNNPKRDANYFHWTNEVCRQLAIPFVNTAMGGDVISNIRNGWNNTDRWNGGIQGRILEYEPTHCILDGGGNDIADAAAHNNTSNIVSEVSSNMEAVVQRLLAEGIRPILFLYPVDWRAFVGGEITLAMTINANNLCNQLFNEYEKIATAYNCDFLDFRNTFMGVKCGQINSQYYQDNVHANEAGQKLIAEFVVQKLIFWYGTQPDIREGTCPPVSSTKTLNNIIVDTFISDEGGDRSSEFNEQLYIDVNGNCKPMKLAYRATGYRDSAICQMLNRN